MNSSLFAQAARVFDGWTDPDTGLRVLRIRTRGRDPDGHPWSTYYHQFSCFLEGGRKVLLHGRNRAPDGTERGSCLLDLTTGQVEQPFPPGYGVAEVRDGTFLAALSDRKFQGERAAIWDLRAGREVAAISLEGWGGAAINFLGDNRRAIAMYSRRHTGETMNYGPMEKPRIYEHPVETRHYLLTPGEEPRLLLDVAGWFCNHIQGCPTDPELYAYDRWPTPGRKIDQAIHIRSLDGRIDEPARLSDEAMRPGDMWGVRDHYLWTPDGGRIVNYFSPSTTPVLSDDPSFNHFQIDWWLSALDWRTGEDLAALYPPGRWGGHMGVSPDSRHIVCVGGPDFCKLFTVDIEGLRRGWNERILCSCPRMASTGNNADPFPYPFALPDQSGLIFTAGWPGPEHGVYLAEWPS